MYRNWRVAPSLVLIAVATSNIGCQTKAQTGAVVGGLGGAAAGAAIGSGSANAGKGALIGGVAGTVGGLIIGNEMDKSERREAVYHSSARDNYGYPAPAAPKATKVTVSDVIAWTRNGVSDRIIVDRIERSGVVFHITAADENYLRDSGVGEDVVRSMKDTARR